MRLAAPTLAEIGRTERQSALEVAKPPQGRLGRGEILMLQEKHAEITQRAGREQAEQREKCQ